MRGSRHIANDAGTYYYLTIKNTPASVCASLSLLKGERIMATVYPYIDAGKKKVGCW